MQPAGKLHGSFAQLKMTKQTIIALVTHAFIAALLLFAASNATAAATPEARVMTALNAANIPQSGKLQFLSPLALTNPDATFKLIAIEKWQGDSAMARMRCVKSADCMPFFVMLRWPSAEERDNSLRAPLLVKEHAPSRENKTMLVRAGDKATLILENKKFRIVEPVTCLENGAQGQKIRVRSADRKKIQVAEVESAGVLKGSL